MRSVTLETSLLALPVRQTLTAAHGLDQRSDDGQIRMLTVVRIVDESGRVGWGECSALNRVGYSSESAETAFTLLSVDPRLDDAGSLTALAQASPMAIAGLEMAEYDLRLKAAGIPLAEFLGIERLTVPAGAAISIGSIEETERAVAAAWLDGFRRIKLKIVPSTIAGFHASTLVEAIAQAYPQLEIQVDANGSFDRTTASEIDAVVEAGAQIVEQPFSPTETQLAAALVRRGATVLADEAATDQAAIERLWGLGACSGVVVKSSRLGGLYPTLELLTWCQESQLPVAAGGMQESGLGRAALAAVAGHEACTITGDISPARRWLAADPWDDVLMVDGMIEVPGAPGIAAPPDLESLQRYTVRKISRQISRKADSQ